MVPPGRRCPGRRCLGGVDRRKRDQCLGPSLRGDRAGIHTRISAGHLRVGRLLFAIAGSGGVADQLPEHTVAPAALVDAALTGSGV